MIRGLLDLFILHSLSQEAKTSYALKEDILFLSGSKPSSGSLYPVLHKLVLSGYIKHPSCLTEKKVYSITAKGKRHLQKLISCQEDSLIQKAILVRSLHYGDESSEDSFLKKMAVSLHGKDSHQVKIFSKYKETHDTLEKIFSNSIPEKTHLALEESYSTFLSSLKNILKKVSK